MSANFPPPPAQPPLPPPRPPMPPPTPPPPVGAPDAPHAPDHRERNVLLIIIALNIAVGIEMIIDLARPDHGDGRPALGLLSHDYPQSVGRVAVWGYLAAWAAALLVGLAAAVHLRTDPTGRLAHRYRLTAGALLTLPFAAMAVAISNVFQWPAVTLKVAAGSVPSTGFAVWAMYKVQRFRKIPVWLLLGAVAWGALVATGFGGTMNTWWLDYSIDYLPQKANIAEMLHNVYTGAAMSAGAFEEIGKGCGVAAAFILFRRHFDGVVSGIVIGAAIGLGFNFVESVEYMSQYNGAGAAQQYWIRQTVGLLGAHAAFTAMTGAGFGIARQLKEPSARRTAIACGWFAAAGGHFANDAVLRWFGERIPHWWPHLNSTVSILVVTPGELVVLQVSFVVIYTWLLRRGLRSQAAALEVELAEEAATGHGAVTEEEVPVLLSKARRFRLKVDSMRDGGGIAAYRALGRLHAAQFDLGMHRWHASRKELDPYAEGEPELRERVLRIKRGQGGAPAPPGRPAAVGVAQ